jgi:hypothetical protein
LEIEVRGWGRACHDRHAGDQDQRDKYFTHGSILFLRDATAPNLNANSGRFKVVAIQPVDFFVDALGFGRPPRRSLPMRVAPSLAQPLELPRLDPRCDEVAEANADPAIGSGIWCRPLLHVDDNANGSPSNLRRVVSIEEADCGADEEDHDERSFQRRDKSLAPDHVPPLWRQRILGIDADPGHREYRRPNTSVPTEVSGWRSTVRKSIARLVPHPGQKTSSHGVPPPGRP